ncbi:hypothetical protein TYRP_001799 [Tyrophagus putrescentiae]|nr:hypothetical protein TYRP_001799 [Tyrophagus putrescentiae]
MTRPDPEKKKKKKNVETKQKEIECSKPYTSSGDLHWMKKIGRQAAKQFALKCIRIRLIIDKHSR